MTLSVKFFKRLFLVILLVIFIIPWVLFITKSVDNSTTQVRNAALESDLQRTKEELNQVKSDLQKAREELSWLQQNQTSTDPLGPSMVYQTLYPEMYCSPQRPDGWVRSANTVYLTFDDGPSDNTDAILNILAEKGVKATFFVTGKTDEASLNRMKRIVAEGHAIGIYTYKRQYREIYASVTSYLEDFALMYDLIYQTTGVKPEIFRFAGGSVNGYNALIYQPLIAEMTRRGFTYYDWNAEGGDNVQGITAATVRSSLVQKASGQERVLALLHDGSEYTVTVEALPGIIDDLLAQGYTFAPLSPEVAPVIFSYDTIS